MTQLDIATLIGILVGFVLMIFGMVFDSKTGLNFSAVGNFIDIPSLLITFGGAFTSILTMRNVKDYVAGLKSISKAFKVAKYEESATIKQIIDLSNVARKEGLLALEEAAGGIEDEFMKKGLLLIVDGTEPDLVRGILETDLVCIEARHKKQIHFWEDLASMGPAWGMIGTLIGLVNMLKNMNDPSSIGPSMAVALITTFYGSLLANWIATPVSAKLSNNNDAEISMKSVMLEGLLSIQAGENPRVIEEKLKSFMAPADRKAISSDGGEE